MIKRNPYLQHTYESFDQPVTTTRRHREPDFVERVFGEDLAARIKSPIFATAAVLLTGVAFAAIIIASYPDSSAQPDESLPVITADANSYKEQPTEPGGMDVPHQDSTIFSTVRSEGLNETPPIENLLAAEQPVNTDEVFGPPSEEAEIVDAATPPADEALEPAAGEETAAVAPDQAVSDEITAATDDAADPAIPDVQVSEVKKIPMKTEKIALVDTDSADAAVMAEKPEMAPAASTPETVAYLRSVLEKKDSERGAKAPATSATETAKAVAVEDAAKQAAAAKIAAAEAATAQAAAEQAARIQPAAGAATAARATITPGNYYVQVASVPSEAGAPQEWSKLQKTFTSLDGLNYRVSKADLAKGTFYRIQAGPMSKDSANSVCGAIKAQKPGGCLITQ